MDRWSKKRPWDTKPENSSTKRSTTRTTPTSSSDLTKMGNLNCSRPFSKVKSTRSGLHLTNATSGAAIPRASRIVPTPPEPPARTTAALPRTSVTNSSTKPKSTPSAQNGKMRTASSSTLPTTNTSSTATGTGCVARSGSSRPGIPTALSTKPTSAPSLIGTAESFRHLPSSLPDPETQNPQAQI